MLKNFFLAIVILIGLTSVCFASLPDADIENGRLDISYGAGYMSDARFDNGRYFWISGNIDLCRSSTEAVGIGYYTSEQLKGYWPPSFADQIDIHIIRQFAKEVDGAPINASSFFGAWIIESPSQQFTNYALLPEFGICLSKKIVQDLLTARLNLVFGIGLGVELGIKPMNNLELTIGYPYYGIKLTF